MAKTRREMLERLHKNLDDIQNAYGGVHDNLDLWKAEALTIQAIVLLEQEMDEADNQYRHVIETQTGRIICHTRPDYAIGLVKLQQANQTKMPCPACRKRLDAAYKIMPKL